MRVSPLVNFAVTLCVVLALTAGAGAQSSASLRGVVTDPTGAVIPGASVTIKSDDTGTSRKTATDTQGEYSFLQIPPGTYKLTTEKSGFATMTKSDIKLLV